MVWHPAPGPAHLPCHAAPEADGPCPMRKARRQESLGLPRKT